MISVVGNSPKGLWPGLHRWIDESFRPKSIPELKAEFVEKLKGNREWESMGCPDSWMLEVSDPDKRQRLLSEQNKYDRDQYIKDFKEAKNSPTGKTAEARPWLRERRVENASTAN